MVSIFPLSLPELVSSKYKRTISTLRYFLSCDLQKVHTFQKSLEAVLQKLGEVEIGQNTLKNAGNIAGTENEILLFRNQLKVGFNHLHYY